MKIKTVLIYLLVLAGFIASRCVKETRPASVNPALPIVGLTTLSYISDSLTQASVVIQPGNSGPISASGVCWDVKPNPTLPASHTWYGPGAGSFATTIGPLKYNTTYYVRSFANNVNGTGYGNQTILKMPPAFTLLSNNLPAASNFYGIVILTQGSTIYCSYSQAGIYKSTDNGDTWAAANNGLPYGTTIYDLVSDGSTLFAANTQQLYSSADGASSWNPVSSLLSNHAIGAMACLNTSIFAGTESGMFVSTDKGNNWSFINGPGHVQINFITVSGGIIYAGYVDNTNVYTQQQVLRSMDGGVTWLQFASSAIPSYAFFSGFAVAGQKIFAASTNGFYNTADNGNSWSSLSSESQSIRGAGATGNVVFAASSSCNYPFYFSTDNGSSFLSLRSPGNSDYYVNCVGCNNAYIFVATSGGLYRLSL